MVRVFTGNWPIDCPAVKWTGLVTGVMDGFCLFVENRSGAQGTQALASGRSFPDKGVI